MLAGFGALLLGYHDAGGRLRYAGRVGTGFTDPQLEQLAERLRKLERESPPLDEGKGVGGKHVHWVRPKLVAQIGFTEWTGDGKLRHPRFLGLRDDKPPEEVRRET